MNILNEASKKKLSSVAFPAVGTGILGFPADVVATCMFEVVDCFSSSNPSTSLQEVRCVVYGNDTKTFDVSIVTKKF